MRRANQPRTAFPHMTARRQSDSAVMLTNQSNHLSHNTHVRHDIEYSNNAHSLIILLHTMNLAQDQVNCNCNCSKPNAMLMRGDHLRYRPNANAM
jgi:hypothetical protein